MIDMSRNMLYHVNNLNEQNTRISYQMATGKVQDKGSEDSVLHSKIINLEDKLRVTEGLTLQIEKTRALNDTADVNMAEVKKALESIKIDTLKALNDGMDRSDKLALATNLKGIRETIIDRVNTQIDGEYIFSGSVTTKETLVKDKDYDQNGKVEFGGDGFLREIAVAPGSYRDRGITAYDAIFYSADKAIAGEDFNFNQDDRIIDENGYEWKLNSNQDKLQKYDKHGDLTSPVDELAVSSVSAEVEATATNIAEPARFKISVPTDPGGRLFEAKHNYLDDLNVMINALEGYSTKLNGEKGDVVDDVQVDVVMNEYLGRTSSQYDASNIGHGELGGRNTVFEVAYEKLQSQLTQYNIFLQETDGADLTKLAMDSKSLEMTYQSLYSTIAKMNQLSLINFLK